MKKRLSICVACITLLICLSFAFCVYAQDETISINKNNTLITVLDESITYDSKAKKPSISVVYTNEDSEEITLKANKDYTVKYSNNINAGKGTITVSGIGDYSGSLSKKFTIHKISLSAVKDSVTVALSKTSYTYNGKAKKPSVTVTYNGTELVKGEDNDFTVSYTNNIKIGKATVTVTGCGNYKGEINTKYKILPGKVKNIKKSVNYDNNTVKLSWKKVSGASRYAVYQYNSSKKKYVLLGTTSKTYYTAKDITVGSVNKFKIRAYKNVDGKKYYGTYGVKNVAVKPKKVTIQYIDKSSTTATVHWKKVKCDGYEIFYSTDKSFKESVKVVKVTSSSKTSYKVKNLSKDKGYYFRVRAYVKYNGKYYYGTKSKTLYSEYTYLIAQYSTSHTNDSNRNTNLKLASKLINGTIVYPGETFSFNETVGQRTAARGFKSAHVYTSSGVSNGIGGGICQVSSTMFNAVLLANLQIVERSAHSYTVSYVPYGRDATVSWGTQDFKWKNNSDYPIKIVTGVSNGKVYCKLYTCKKVSKKNVKISVTKSNGTYTLKRTVSGKVNYTTYSKYKNL